MQHIDRTIPYGDRKRTRSGSALLRAACGVLLLTAAFLASCDQASIFYDISNETEPKDPVIPGTPSRMVMFPANSSQMWASNGELYMFDGSAWFKKTGPSGMVRSLAVAGNFMYALTLDGGSTTRTRLWRTADGTNWTQLSIADSASPYSFLESIYAAGPAGTETLFIGAHKPAGKEESIKGYAVLYAHGNDIQAVGDIPELKPEDAAGALAGAAWDGSRYYLATTMEGIFWSGTANTGYALVNGTEDDTYLLSGLTAIGSTVVAVGRGEYILYGNSSNFKKSQKFSDIMFLGAMATWDDGDASNGSPDLLLAAIDDDDDSYTYGYREIVLEDGAFPASPDIKSPGNGKPTTVADDDQYDSSLGREALNALFQYNVGSTRVLFASTYSDGLWSYRDEEWNAEE